MTTNTYTGAVTGPITVANGNEADLTNATVTASGSGVPGDGVEGLGAVIVKLVGSTIMSSDRGVTDDASGTLTVSLDGSSSIMGKDGIGSDDAVIALTNAGMIHSNQSGFNGVYLGQSGSTVVNSGTISGGAGQYAIDANAKPTITNSGTLTAGSSGALEFGAGGGTLYLSDGTTAGTINGGIVDSGPLTISTNGLASYTLSSVVSGAGSLLLNGPGTLTLSATNTYTGGTTVTGGATLVTAHDNNVTGSDALGSGALTLDGGTLSSDHESLVNALVLGAGGGVISGSAVAGGVSGAGDLTFTGAGGGGANGQIGGGFGPSASTADTHTGATVLTQGVTLYATTSISASSAVRIDAGSALLMYADQTIGSLSGGGGVSIGDGDNHTLAVGLDGRMSTFSGVLSNGNATLALTKTGGGALTLSGASTYTGGTTISGGVLDLSHATVGAFGAITSGAAGRGGIAFASGMQTLQVEHVALGADANHTLAYSLTTFGVGDGDVIDVRGIASTDYATYDGSDLLTLHNSGTGAVEASLHIGAGYGGDTFTATADADGMGAHVSAAVTPAPPPPPPAPPAPSGPPAGSHVLTPGANSYQAGNGGELVYGEGGSDTIIGGSGNDALSAGGYPGQATQGSASDHTLIEGGGGADSLVGGVGHDQLFGQIGNDHITVVAGSQGASVYGGQGDDVIDASASNAPNYLSGDLGNDTIMSGAGFETVLGGQGDDSIVGGATAGAGSLQYLLGNQGNDHISYAGADSVEIFGGQDNDTLSVTTSGQGQTHYLFGNLGDDTLTAGGGYNSLYGGQGNDVVSAFNGGGHNYLSGDIGDDVVTTSYSGFDTVRGGPGADTINLTGHDSAAGDTVLIGVGDSTAAQGAGETNLDHIAGFNFASDHIVVAGHAAGTAANVTTYMDAASNSSEAGAFASAYLYAYGDGFSAHAAHVGTTEYLAVQESYGGTNAVYVFTADHTAVAFTGVTAGSFQAGAIVGG